MVAHVLISNNVLWGQEQERFVGSRRCTREPIFIVWCTSTSGCYNKWDLIGSATHRQWNLCLAISGDDVGLLWCVSSRCYFHDEGTMLFLLLNGVWDASHR